MTLCIKYGDQAFEKYVCRFNEMSNVVVLKMKDRAARVFKQNVSVHMVNIVAKTKLNWTVFQMKGKQTIFRDFR